MKFRTSSSASFTSILPFCQDHKSLPARIAIFSWSQAIFPNLLEALILIIEYLQLMSQSFFLNYRAVQNLPRYTSSTIFNSFIVFAKIFGPGFFVLLEGRTSITCIIILAIITCICLIKYAFFVYTVVSAARNKYGSPFLMRIWGFIFRTQSRVGYFLSTSFCTQIIIGVSQGLANLRQGESTYLIIWASVIIILEFVLAFGLLLGFPYYLPTKSFLSAKHNKLEIITLLQKIFMQILDMVSLPRIIAIAWVVRVINMILYLIRNYMFFRTLPTYKKTALICQMIMVVSLSSLNLGYLAHAFLWSVYGSEEDISPGLTSIIWVVLTILACAAALLHLDQIIFNLITQTKNLTPEYLIHKVIAIKDLIKNSHIPRKLASKYRWEYFLDVSLSQSLASSLNLSPESLANIKIDFDSKESLNSLFILYLENLSRLLPKNRLVKLYLAYYYGKKMNHFGLSMNAINDLRVFCPSYTSELNISILRHQMQKILFKIKTNSTIDIFTYIKSIKKVTHLKQAMVEQAELQIKLCQEMNKNAPNLANVYNYSLQVVNYRTKIKKMSLSVIAAIPEYYIEPLAICAHYNLLLNYHIRPYLKCEKEYERRFQKYKYSFDADKLCQENVFQHGNFDFLTTGLRDNTVSVTYFPKWAANIYGRDIVGESASNLVNPSLQGFFKVAIEQAVQTTDSLLIGKPFKVFHWHKEGYILPGELYIDISPVLSRDICYFGILRHMHPSKQFILVNEDGSIEAGTKKISYELGLLSNSKVTARISAHISQISSELAQVNHAFNMIAFPDKYQQKVPDSEPKLSVEGVVSATMRTNKRKESLDIKSTGTRLKGGSRKLENMDLERANDLYAIYTGEGKCIRLKSLDRAKAFEFLFYDCTIENQLYGSTLLKVITVQKVGDENAELEKVRNHRPTMVQPTQESVTPKRRVTKITTTQLQKIEQVNTEFDASDLEHHIDDKEDEKGSRWIDFERLKQQHTPVVPGPKIEPLSPTTADIPAATNTAIPISRRSLLITAQGRRDSKLRFIVENKVISVPLKEDTSNFGKVENKEVADKHSKATHTYGISNHMKVSKVFHEAVNTKYYPLSYRVFLRLWYVLLSVILVYQFLMNLQGTNEMRDFQSRKDMVLISNYRSDTVLTCHKYIRTLWELALMPDSEDARGMTLSFASFVKAGLQVLGIYNFALLEATTSFNNEKKSLMFYQDIKVYEVDSQSYTQVNSFQAIDQIMEAGFKGTSIAETNASEAIPYYEMILKNDLNDLLINSDSISSLMLKFVADSNQSTIDSLLVNIVLTVCGIIAMETFFGIMVYILYKRQISCLLAFIRLNKQGVKTVQQRALSFTKTIQEELQFKRIFDSDLINYCYKDFGRSNLYAKGNNGTNRNTRGAQSYNNGGISRKFLLYVVRIVILLFIITGIISINQTMISSSLKKNQEKLAQISFVGDLRLQLNLVLAEILEIITGANTTFVRNIPVLSDVQPQIAKYITLVSQVPDMFKETNSNYNPSAIQVLYTDACIYMIDEINAQCVGALHKDRTNGLLQALSDLESYINNAMGNIGTTMTVADLNGFDYKDYFLKLSFDSLLDILNTNFDDENQNQISSNVLLSIIITLLLILICVGVHYRILKRVGESDNNFKRILEVFPARIVLSNFVLKSFLLKTSDGTLDSIREEI